MCEDVTEITVTNMDEIALLYALCYRDIRTEMVDRQRGCVGVVFDSEDGEADREIKQHRERGVSVDSRQYALAFKRAKDALFSARRGYNMDKQTRKGNR